MNHARDHICWAHPAPHHCEHRLDVRGITATYPGGICALRDVSFCAHCGQTLALMGPNGAGKSTLLAVLAGLLPPQTGDALWNGRPLAEVRREVAWLPQRSEVDWSFPITVRTLVQMGRYPSLGPWRRPDDHDEYIVQKAIDTLGLTGLEQRCIGELSGGQQQRAFLARALAQEAHILLLDEPYTGLDHPGAETLGELLGSLAREGRLVIASYHDVRTAPRYFDLALLMRTSVVAFGPCARVLTPASLSEAYGLPASASVRVP